MDVQRKSGTLQGEERDGMRIVLGIPSAAPPVGDQRFAAPQAVVAPHRFDGARIDAEVPAFDWTREKRS